jgi:RNA polymerase sigma factor (sigma-70 family)
MGNYTNKEIIKGILERRSKVYLFLYNEYLPMIKNFILKNNGDETDAKDLFQDTLIIIFKKINSGDLKLTSSFKTYFYAICKYLWFQRLEVMQKTDILDRQDDSWNEVMEFTEYVDYEEEKLYQKHFKMLDDDCQKILEGFFDKRPFKVIANDLHFRPSYIKKLKFNCKEKLIRSIMNDPIYYELMDHKYGVASYNQKINGESPRKDGGKNNSQLDSKKNETKKGNKQTN